MVKITSGMRRMVVDPDFARVVAQVVEAQNALRAYETNRRIYRPIADKPVAVVRKPSGFKLTPAD